MSASPGDYDEGRLSRAAEICLTAGGLPSGDGHQGGDVMAAMAARAWRGEVGTVLHVPWATLDYEVSAALRALLQTAHQPGTALVLDLSQVSFVDSSALGVLVSAHRRLRAEGSALLVSGVDERVLRVLRISGLVRHLHIIEARPRDDTAS